MKHCRSICIAAILLLFSSIILTTSSIDEQPDQISLGTEMSDNKSDLRRDIRTKPISRSSYSPVTRQQQEASDDETSDNISSDKDKDGIMDSDDFIEGGRLQIEKRPKYVSSYYSGGYPPDDIAVCTDVIWRAFKNAGYNLKSMIDEDISNNVSLYPRVDGHPDPNIDFRRVRNLNVFFKRHADVLTTEIIPGDEENLKQWQGGDLVTFILGGEDHIAIVSNKKDEHGVPFIIHTFGAHPVENNMLAEWSENITYHFRYPPQADKGL